MKSPEKYPKLYTFEELPQDLRWDACIAALQDDFTVSFRDICRILKCNRAWVSRYIRPNCLHIYLSSGVGKSQNYLQLAAARLGREMRDSIWFKTEEFENLIKENIASCTRQTIVIPIEWLIKKDKIEEFRVAYKKIMEEIKDAKNPLILTRLLEQKKALVKSYRNEIGCVVYAKLPNKYKRTATAATEISVPEFDLKDLVAVHDLKSYGDTDEEIYRSLFSAGACRVEIKIPDLDGCISKKIYYLYCKDGIDLKETVEAIPIAYEDYVRFFLG